jgi:hypothetical protein
VRHSESTIEESVRLYQSGLKPTEVGDRLGISPTNVARWAKRAGVKRDDLSGDRSCIVAEEHKCSGCHEVLPASAFSPNPSRPGGIHHYCRACARERGSTGRVRTGRVHERWLSDDERATIAEKYWAGASAKEAGAVVGRSECAAWRVLAERGIASRGLRHARVYHVNAKYFADIDTEEKAYWLGFIAADGCVRRDGSVVIALASQDHGHLKKFRQCIGSNHPIRRTRALGGYGVNGEARITIGCTEMVEDLARQGIHPAKSLTYEPWDGPAHLMPAYWRGMIDGDGSLGVAKSGQPWIGLVGSESTCWGFSDFVHLISSHRLAVRRHKTIWEVSTHGPHIVRRIVGELYQGASVALDRKAERAARILSLVLRGDPRH